MREVLAHLDGRPSALCPGERGGIVEGALVELNGERAAGLERGRGELEQAPEHVEPVRAAVEGELWLVVDDLGGDLLA